MGTRIASVRAHARELYSTTWKGAPEALHSTDGAHTEMLSRLQWCTCLQNDRAVQSQGGK